MSAAERQAEELDYSEDMHTKVVRVRALNNRLIKLQMYVAVLAIVGAATTVMGHLMRKPAETRSVDAVGRSVLLQPLKSMEQHPGRMAATSK